MKQVTIILGFLIMLSACSHAPSYLRIEKRSEDLLIKESYQRYTQEHIVKEMGAKDGKEISLTLKCYGGKVENTLTASKTTAIANLKSAAMWIDLANCFYLQGAMAKARFFYRYALSVPKLSARQRAIIYNNLGIIALQAGNSTLAQGLLTRSVKEDKMFLTPHFNLGHLLVRLGLWEQASAHLKPLLTKGPKDVDLLFALGSIHLFRKEYLKANQYFAQIGNVYYQRESISNFYALSLLNSGKVADALTIWKMGKRGDQASKYYSLTKSVGQRIEQAIEALESKKKILTTKKEQADG